jgi:8-oxo-dGTP diphosphatase
MQKSDSHDHAGKHIHVACAIIEHKGLVLAVRRGPEMIMPLKWEFPGGKIKPDESAEACVRREVAEELGLQIAIDRKLPPSTHKYPRFTVTLYPFVCSIEGGEIFLHEHGAAAWLKAEELLTLDWAEADVPIIRAYCASSVICTRAGS